MNQAPDQAVTALTACARLVHAHVTEPRLVELRRRVVTQLLGVDLMVTAGAVLEDGTDDAVLDAAQGVCRVIDPGAG